MNIISNPIGKPSFTPKQYKIIITTILIELVLLAIVSVLIFQKSDPVIAPFIIAFVAICILLLNTVVFAIWRMISALTKRPDSQEVPDSMYEAHRKFSLLGIAQIILLAATLPISLILFLISKDDPYVILVALVLIGFIFGLTAIVYAISYSIFKSRNKPSGKAWKTISNMYSGSIYFSIFVLPVVTWVLYQFIMSTISA